MVANTNGIVSCCQDFGVYCITQLEIKYQKFVLSSWDLLIYQKKENLQIGQKKKKHYLYFNYLVLNLQHKTQNVGNIIFNLAQKTMLVFYFFQLYVYYAFLIYIVFYFARKTLSVRTFKPYQILQLKIYCICLISLFTIFLIWNLYDYITSLSQSYSLCQKQIFHIIRMIGFIVNLVLIAVARSLNLSIKRNLELKSTILKNFVNFEENCKKINRQRINFWILVYVTFFGQLLYFIEDIYFLVQGPTETCHLYLDIIQSEARIFQYCLLLLVVLIQVQLPFSVTIYAFWFQKPVIKQESDSIEFEEDYFKTIKLQEKPNSHSSEQITTLKE
ncbi:unnamed protein product (macronuclear) [Paramecium tetraurelia]|uniref:THH1/TOM1/TOM3 domain-containing protein n=1 Tax=Paramecium tetraurelia TaxID=5888 RepID=A0DFK4_PARTE|nr:uncharacterized protein GSPATT00016634001 [Paramecium tetraurelia]CAK81821.1 unnamed protein product [Paramecium tetraurelia]|eukprot:XP_001449218.1 hypothetical protein (macronuclear) [Paramecium tetraurelia strain d4-2]